MDPIVSIYSKVYLDREDDSWSARPSKRILERLMEREEESNRWIVEINGFYIALGAPVLNEDDRWGSKLYLPPWILSSMNSAGDGEEMEVRFLPSESLSKATSLSLRVLGEVPEGIDMRELLEEPLSSLGVLKTGQILPAPILDGLQILVESIEPAGEAVFLDGNDVALNLEMDMPLAPSAPSVPSAPSAPSALSPPEDFSSFLPPSAPFAPSPSPLRHGTSSTFVPFSGIGRRLCD